MKYLLYNYVSRTKPLIKEFNCFTNENNRLYTKIENTTEKEYHNFFCKF